jgi:hypothetical protein
MPPAFLLALLVAVLLALLPVWRLRVAGWPPRTLFAAWVLYAVGIFVAVGFPGPARFLAPILVLAFVAPFVAGPERLTRLLHGRGKAPNVIVNVTPRPPTGLPEPTRDVQGEVLEPEPGQDRGGDAPG